MVTGNLQWPPDVLPEWPPDVLIRWPPLDVITVNANPANWSFDFPQPTVTHTPGTIDHMVDAGPANWSFDVSVHGVAVGTDKTANAGDVTWTFAIPEPTVTKVRVASDYTVDANPVIWYFDIPRPHGIVRGHTRHVNPGDVNWLFRIPEPHVTVTRPPVVISHVVDAGPAEWDFVVPRVASVRLGTTKHVDAGNVAWHFIVAQPDVTVVRSTVVDHAVDASAAIWDFVVPRVAGIQVGRTKHVDAGAAAWRFAIPEPAVTKARVNPNHAVDAGNANWTFAIPQPTASRGIGHRVDAGNVAWTFAVPQPTILRGVTRRVNAGAANWVFAIPIPTIAISRGVGTANWTFNIPQPAVTRNRPWAVDAGPAYWTFEVLDADGFAFIGGLIGPDGNSLPETLGNGVASYDFMSINGRIFTAYQREPFLGPFGVGLLQAIYQESIPAPALRQRMANSFVGDPGYVGVDKLEIDIGGGVNYNIELTLEATNGSS